MDWGLCNFVFLILSISCSCSFLQWTFLFKAHGDILLKLYCFAASCTDHCGLGRPSAFCCREKGQFQFSSLTLKLLEWLCAPSCLFYEPHIIYLSENYQMTQVRPCFLCLWTRLCEGHSPSQQWKDPRCLHTFPTHILLPASRAHMGSLQLFPTFNPANNHYNGSEIQHSVALGLRKQMYSLFI